MTCLNLMWSRVWLIKTIAYFDCLGRSNTTSLPGWNAIKLHMSKGILGSISHNVTSRSRTPPEDLIASTIQLAFSMSLPLSRLTFMWAKLNKHFVNVLNMKTVYGHFETSVLSSA